jgi:transcriptional regulator with XRE-family HTH domain
MNVRGELIKQLRIERGWTQQQLAEITDLSLRTIQRVENQSVASNESVSSLAAVMELSREQILSPMENPELRRQAGRQAAWMLLLAVGVGILLGAGGTLLLMH